MKFTYPLSLEPFLNIQTKQDLTNLIEKQLSILKLKGYISYRINQTSRKYIYAKCKFCTAKLYYIHKDGNFVLNKAQRDHQHKKSLSNKALIKSIIQQLPQTFEMKDIKKFIKQKFQIANSTLYRIINEIKNSDLSLLDLINCFKQKDMIGYYEPLQINVQIDLPELLIVTSLEARKAFQSFGQIVSIDFTYNVFQKPNNGSQYRLGVLAGISGSMKLIPFGAVATIKQTTQNIANILYQFFKLLGGKPKVIISDEQASIKSALNLLRDYNLWDGRHVLDSYHILKNIKKKLSEKHKIDLFSNIIKSRTSNQFQFHRKIAEQNLNQGDLVVLEKLIENSNHTCFSQIEDCFMGLGVSSFNQKINDIVKSKIPMSLKLLPCMKKIGLLFNNMLTNNLRQAQFQKFKVEDYMNIPELAQIRKIICKRVLKILMQQISNSLSCIIIRKDNENVIFEDKFGEEKVTQIEEKYVCSCGFNFRSGVPCQHILKILILQQQKIMPYISQRWILKQKIEIPTLTKLCFSRPRKTRRNRLR